MYIIVLNNLFLIGYTPDEIAEHSEAHDCWTVY